MRKSSVEVKDMDEDRVIDLVTNLDIPPSYKKKEADCMVRNFIKFLMELGVMKQVLPPVIAILPVCASGGNTRNIFATNEDLLRNQSSITGGSLIVSSNFVFPMERMIFSDYTPRHRNVYASSYRAENRFATRRNQRI